MCFWVQLTEIMPKWRIASLKFCKLDKMIDVMTTWKPIRSTGRLYGNPLVTGCLHRQVASNVDFYIFFVVCLNTNKHHRDRRLEIPWRSCDVTIMIQDDDWQYNDICFYFRWVLRVIDITAAKMVSNIVSVNFRVYHYVNLWCLLSCA